MSKINSEINEKTGLDGWEDLYGRKLSKSEKLEIQINTTCLKDSLLLGKLEGWKENRKNKAYLLTINEVQFVENPVI